jgi:hypothetical protein
VAFVEHDEEIETFAANGADEALGEGIRLGSARCDDDLANAQALDAALEVGAVDGIAITEKVSGAGLVGEGVDDLLSRPRGRGLVGDADVYEFSAVVAEYHEAEEEAKGQGRYDEEVDGCDVVTMGSQEGPPGRRRVTGGATHVRGDGEGGDVIAEEAEFGLNPAPAPGGGCRGPCVESRCGSPGRSADDPVSGVGTSGASRDESSGGAKRRPWRLQ